MQNRGKPTISSLTPATAAPGAKIIIKGSKFSLEAKAYFGNVQATISILDSHQIRATIPTGQGQVAVTVTTAYGLSNAIQFAYQGVVPVPPPVPPPPTPPPPTPPPVGDYTPSGSISLSSGMTIANKSFDSHDPVNGGTEIQGNGIVKASLSHLLLQNAHYGLKIGSGGQSSQIAANDLIFRHCVEPLFLANVSDSTFENLDIQADKQDTNQWHCIYMERENYNLVFRNVKLAGGSGYCLQLYREGVGGHDILFDGLTLDATTGRYPLVIQSYSNVTFKNVTIIGGPAGGSLVRFYGGSDNVVFNGFTAIGGDRLVTWQYDQPTNVVFKNGTYHGSTLSDKMSAFTFQNVNLEP